MSNFVNSWDYDWNDIEYIMAKKKQKMLDTLGVDFKEIAIKKESAQMAVKHVSSEPQEKLSEVTSTVTSPKIIIPNNKPKQVFLHMKPTRVSSPHGCLQVSIKAPLFEDFFKSISPDKEELMKAKPDYAKVCLPMSKARKADGSPIYLIRISTPMSDLMGKPQDGFLLPMDLKTPNMTLLQAVGLSEGVDFLFPDLYTKESIEEGLNKFVTLSKRIFKQYISPIQMEFEINIRETA